MCYFLIYLGNRIDIKKYQVISSGRLVLFSPDWLCTHKGNIPLSNPKYILTGLLHSKINFNDTLYPFYKLKYNKIEI